MLNYKNYGRLWKVYGRSLVRYGTPRKLWNAARTEWAYRRRRADVPSAPYILFLEPLYYCNLACPLCDRQVFPHARRTKREAGRLPLVVVDKVLDEIGDSLFQCQIFGQGEPMIDWPLTRTIIERMHRRRIFTLVSTNCTLVTPEMADEVVQSGLDHLVCAIDGVTQEGYEAYRAGGQVADALRGMRLFVEAKRRHNSRILIEWQFLVHRHNVQEMDEARRLADELGVYLRFSPLRGMEFDARLQQYWLPENGPFDAGRQQPGETVAPWPCYFLWRALTLNSNARLAKCLIYQNVAEYGHLLEGSVMAYFNGPEMQRARQLFDPRPVPEGNFPAPCATCSFYERHHGGPNQDKFGSLGLQAREAPDYAYAAPGPRT